MRLQLRSYQQPRMPLAIASSGNPVSLELAGKCGMLFLSPAGGLGGIIKPRRNNGMPSKVSPRHGTQTSRDNWRIATCVCLADTGKRPGTMSRRMSGGI